MNIIEHTSKLSYKFHIDKRLYKTIVSNKFHIDRKLYKIWIVASIYTLFTKINMRFKHVLS